MARHCVRVGDGEERNRSFLDLDIDPKKTDSLARELFENGKRIPKEDVASVGNGLRRGK
jgi:hypothetical protein